MADLEPIRHEEGDRNPSIEVQLIRGDGSIVDLTGKALSQVTFIIKNLETNEVEKFTASSFVSPETSGKAVHDILVSDTAVPASKEVRCKFEDPAASGIFVTFPICDRLLWHISPKLG